MVQFVHILERGVKVNAHLIGDASHPLVAALDESLANLRAELVPLSGGMLM